MRPRIVTRRQSLDALRGASWGLLARFLGALGWLAMLWVLLALSTLVLALL